MTLAELGNKATRCRNISSANIEKSTLKWTTKQLVVTQASLTTCEWRDLSMHH